MEAPQSERCRTVQISKAKLDTASAACEGGLVAHDRSGVFYWGSRVSAVWELVRAEPTSLTLATKPHPRGGAVTGGFNYDRRDWTMMCSEHARVVPFGTTGQDKVTVTEKSP